VRPQTIGSARRTGPRTLGRMFFSSNQGFAACLISPSARLWEWCIAVDDHNLRPDVQEPAGLRIPGHRAGGPKSLSCVPLVINNTALSAPRAAQAASTTMRSLLGERRFQRRRPNRERVTSISTDRA
jgi:hypothetical protein